MSVTYNGSYANFRSRDAPPGRLYGMNADRFKHKTSFSYVRANSLVCTMPFRAFIGACVNKAVHMYDSFDYRLTTILKHATADSQTMLTK